MGMRGYLGKFLPQRTLKVFDYGVLSDFGFVLSNYAIEGEKCGIGL